MTQKFVSTPIPIELYRKFVNKTLDENITIRKGLAKAVVLYVEVKA
jgi:hypothetical protein